MARRDDILKKIHPRYLPVIEAARRGGAVSPIQAPQAGLVHGAMYSMPNNGRMLRQKSDDGMNKTEREFSAHMAGIGIPVEREPVTFRLGNGVRYTPDFGAWDAQGKLHCWEVKGHMEDDAAVKIKVAASRFPKVKFVLVRKSGRTISGIRWSYQEMVP